MEELNKLIGALEGIERKFTTEEGIASHSANLRLNEETNEVVLEGNAAALIYLAGRMLQLASQKMEGGHFQFDETGIFNRLDRNFVIAYKKAGWD